MSKAQAERELGIMVAEHNRSNELIAKYKNEYEQDEVDSSHEVKIELITKLVKYQRNLAEIKKYQAQQSKPVIKELRDQEFSWFRKHIQDFVPMNSKLDSKRVKRPGIQLLSEEEIKKMMEIVPVEEVYIEALQEIWLGLIMYKIPYAIKGVLSLDLSKVTITLQSKALDPSLGTTDGTSLQQYQDAKTLFEAIQERFGGNDATKKIQKTLLKQIQLAILGENISREDLNLKFLRRLPSEWNTHVVIWRNKPDLDTIRFDDLYNNFKIVEQEVKRTVTTSSSSGSQNMAFVSTPGNTNKVNTANVQVSTASTLISTTSTNDNSV
ncbi:hypothetical protein Tco_1005925 [Tanacetum coccineum]|uniref:Uncharacterized protein n=1 Tax=Tanacetum coccineum TaxID=301880 RepID=A0ABQ5FIL5_9ASTR